MAEKSPEAKRIAEALKQLRRDFYERENRRRKAARRKPLPIPSDVRDA